jgi:3-hydroxyisobutyrate dehydrogenase
MQHVALLGLGIMGTGMAANWLQKGYPLTVYNRTRSKAEPFAAQGAQVASTPREAAAQAEIIVAMVGDDPASRAVWLGDDGALAGARPGTVLVECSTLSPDWVRELAALAAAQRCEFLDAPVTGSKPQAAAGQLNLFVGGDSATLEKVRPALEAVSARISYLGPNGAGATWKLINNMMAAVQLVALSEGMTLAQKAGIDMQQAVNLILESATASGIVKGKLPRIAESRYDDTDFSLNWMHKDIRYALALAQQLGVTLNSVEAAEIAFHRANDKGLGDQDMASVYEGVRG